MRVIIDFQGIQTLNGSSSLSSYVQEVIRIFIEQAQQYEIWLVLNATYLASAISIRSAYENLIPKERIKVFEKLATLRGTSGENDWKENINNKIDDFFLDSLQPDAVLKVILFENCSGNAYSSNQLSERNTAVINIGKEKVILNLENSSYNNRLKSQKEFVKQVLQALTRHVNRRTAAISNKLSCQKKPRLAFISPLPPEKTGIADYSTTLLPYLLEYYEIDLVTSQTKANLPETLSALKCYSVAYFKQHAHLYDRIIYQIGNSHFHSYMFELLRLYPGVVVLHDFFLSHSLAYEEAWGESPSIWTQALYHSHGYKALKERKQAIDIDYVKNTYPCNLAVIEQAKKVIVHSEYSAHLARQWYGAQVAREWCIIPHPRELMPIIDKNAARETLGIDANAFVVCSFGILNITKCNHELLTAWLASFLAADTKTLLVFVGENNYSEYGMQLVKRINESGYGQRICITGWVNNEVYQQYLYAADVAVQLRCLTRGETSWSVLDCMSSGLPVIVNANGSMAELPNDAVWMLPDVFSHDELRSAFEVLSKDKSRRAKLGYAARQVIENDYSAKQCAARYMAAVESAYAVPDFKKFIQSLVVSPNFPATEKSIKLVARLLAPLSIKNASKQLLVDVSAIIQTNLKTGIERVVRAQLLELIKTPPAGFRVEPVYFLNDNYFYARQFAADVLGLPQAFLTDAPIDVASEDIFYGLDYSPVVVAAATEGGIFTKWKALGVTINFLVYDLLPVLHPDFFPAGTNLQHSAWLREIACIADRLIGISNTVVDGIYQWLEENPVSRLKPLKLAVTPLGSDVSASAPSLGMPCDSESILAKLTTSASFLMVGTIEPRKGYLQVLDAFEQLWREGRQVSLVIVGQKGWKQVPTRQRRIISTIINKLQMHPEAGKGLFWLEDISDEYLEKVYASCKCFIAASEAEGFGLPLVEASQYGIPLIVRDLPVFREIAQSNAYYFQGSDPDDLVEAIKKWLLLAEEGEVPTSQMVKRYSWSAAIGELVKIFLDDTQQRTWPLLSCQKETTETLAI